MKQVRKTKINFVSGGLDTNPNDPSAVDPGVNREPGDEGSENGEQAPCVPPLSSRIYFEPKSKVTETPGTPDPQADEPGINLGELPPPNTKNNPFRENPDGQDPENGDGIVSLANRLGDAISALQNGKLKRAKLVLDNGKTIEIKEAPAEDPTAPSGSEEEPTDTWTILGWTWKKKYWIMSGAGLLVLLVVLIILATKKN